MYRYFKSLQTGEYVVMYDNPLCGPVEDKTYMNEADAKRRVSEMNECLLKIGGVK